MYAQWPRFVGNVEVCPVQLPGRENRLSEQHFEMYEKAGSDTARALAPWMDRPYGIFGHSSGVLPAFETARGALEMSLPMPTHFIASGHVAPHDSPCDRLLGLNTMELRQEVVGAISSRGINPSDSLIGVSMEVLANDLNASRAYRIEDPIMIASNILLLIWTDDTEVSQHQLEGWRLYGSKNTTAHLPGGHYDLLKAPAQLLNSIAELDWD